MGAHLDYVHQYASSNFQFHCNNRLLSSSRDQTSFAFECVGLQEVCPLPQKLSDEPPIRFLFDPSPRAFVLRLRHSG